MIYNEDLVDRLVTYTLEHGGHFYRIEHVPARVIEETGEQFFSPATVGRLYETIFGKTKPGSVLETPVYEYSELG